MIELPDGFWDRVDKAGPVTSDPLASVTTPCWLWTGNVPHDGYGRFYMGTQLLAHRLSYEVEVGPVPEGMELDHLCRTRACVRPDHLEPVTRLTNVRRGAAPGARAVRTGRCMRGHSEWALRPNGRWRVCRACHRLRQSRLKALKAAS